MISLFQTTNRALAIFLSFFMKIENVQFSTTTGGVAKSQNLGTISLIRGSSRFEDTQHNTFSGVTSIVKHNIRFSDMTQPLSFKTAGANRIKIASYTVTIVATPVITYALGVVFTGSPSWGL